MKPAAAGEELQSDSHRRSLVETMGDDLTATERRDVAKRAGHRLRPGAALLEEKEAARGDRGSMAESREAEGRRSWRFKGGAQLDEKR